MRKQKSKISETSAFVERFVEVCGSSEPTEISKLLDITYQAAKNYLQGRLPKTSILLKISEKTGCSIDWLLMGKGEKFVEMKLTEDTLIPTDQLRAFIKNECQKIVGEMSGVLVEDGQEKVIVLKSEDIKEEKAVDESNTSSKKHQ